MRSLAHSNRSSTVAAPRKSARRSRRAKRSFAVLLGSAALAIAFAAPAMAAQYTSLYAPSGFNRYSATATRSGWTGTVSVNGVLYTSRGCVTLYEQGHNNVFGYGNWDYVNGNCASQSAARVFSFSVSNFYSDSVALRICDYDGCRSTHVWG
jgi:hypothetical protein